MIALIIGLVIGSFIGAVAVALAASGAADDAYRRGLLHGSKVERLYMGLDSYGGTDGDVDG